MEAKVNNNLTIFDKLKEFINKDETKGKIAYILLFLICELTIIIPFIIVGLLFK